MRRLFGLNLQGCSTNFLRVVRGFRNQKIGYLISRDFIFGRKLNASLKKFFYHRNRTAGGQIHVFIELYLPFIPWPFSLAFFLGYFFLGQFFIPLLALFSPSYHSYGCPDGSKFNENFMITNSMENNCLQWN